MYEVSDELRAVSAVNPLPITIPGIPPVNVSQINGSSISLGQTTMAASVPVTWASDQSAVTANAGTNLNTSALLTTSAHDAAFGTAGSADAQVRTVQGVASMTPLQVQSNTANLATETTVGTVATNTTRATTTLSYISAGATEDEHAVKATAGRLHSILATNTAAAVAFLKCENDTAANTAPGTDTPEFRLAIPGATTGAGFIAANVDWPFATAWTCWIVTGAADSDVAEVGANAVMVNYSFE
jgi:hypothetical protein